MNGGSLRVLLVEDDPADSRLLRETLAGQDGGGFDVVRVEGPAEALARLRDEAFDVILLDPFGRDSGWLEVVSQAVAAADEAPIVVLAGPEDEALAAEAVERGAEDYILKGRTPYMPLGRAVQHTVERRRMQAEARRQERALQASEDRFRRIIQENADGILIVDRAGTARLVNSAAEDLLGCPAEDLVGRPFGLPLVANETVQMEVGGDELCIVEMRVVETRWEDSDAYLVSLHDVTARTRVLVAEERLKAADLIARHNAQLTEANTRLSAVLRDLKRSQDSLVQSEKMAALGRLTAGVAHELNNPLMGIMNYVQYCRERTPEGDARHERLLKAERELDRCARIVNSMLSYSREGDHAHTARRVQLDFREAVERALALLSKSIRDDNIELSAHVPGDLPRLWAEPDWMQQVLVNLIANARDAVAEADRKHIAIRAAAENSIIRICVVDSGCGMSKETREKIFDPFFTTKPTGEGTGLGLSVCHNLVEKMGGSIEVDSSPGEGTTVTVTLPLDPRRAAHAGQEAVAA